MSDKVKRGIGYIITGVLYIGIGALEIALPSIPGIVLQIASAVVLVAGIFGVRAMFPE